MSLLCLLTSTIFQVFFPQSWVLSQTLPTKSHFTAKSPVRSDWTRGLVPGWKTDGSVRVTTDLTLLNSNVIPACRPSPNIRAIHVSIVRAKRFPRLEKMLPRRIGTFNCHFSIPAARSPIATIYTTGTILILLPAII